MCRTQCIGVADVELPVSLLQGSLRACHPCVAIGASNRLSGLDVEPGPVRSGEDWMHITQWIDHCSRWRRELVAALGAEPPGRPLVQRWGDDPCAANDRRRCADRDNRQWRDTEPYVADAAP